VFPSFLRSDSPEARPVTADLTALLGSRICHDLISPLGAIGNGVELLSMAPGGAGAELALISQSVAHARARLCFFRVAFGTARRGHPVPLAEVRCILDDMTRDSRLRIEFHGAPDPARPDVKLCFLLLMCLETALPYGGRIVVEQSGGGWQLLAEATRTRIDAGLWARLADRDASADLQPSQVQFALAAAELAARGIVPSVAPAEERIVIGFRTDGPNARAPE